MDYADIAEWNGSIRVAVLNGEDVERALSAFDLWGSAIGIASSEDLDRLRRFGNALVTLVGEDLHVATTTTPPNAPEIISEVIRA
jgi:hypothetical protein